MASTKFFLIFVLFGGLLLSGCVSVNIGPKQAGRSQGLRVENPADPFVAMKDSTADQAWQSTRTGNMIAYLSECPEPAMGLDILTSESLAVLKNNKVIDQKNKFFNGREALETRAEGSLDGIAMKMSTLVFKRNGCSFLITYAARKDHYADEEQIFVRFLEGFQAP